MSSAKWNSCCLFGAGSDTFKGFFAFFFFFYNDVNYMLEFIILLLHPIVSWKASEF